MKIGLNTKIITAGLMVLILFMLLLSYSNKVIEQLLSDNELSKKLGKLQQLTILMSETASHYKDNAPRDYESYNRDLKVFYQSLQENLSSLQSLIERVNHDFFNRNTTANFLIDSKIIETNDAEFQNLITLQTAFSKGISEKIGDNPEEPRLEWANEFIADDESQLFSHITKINTDFNSLLLAHSQAAFSFNRYVSLIVALTLIILLFWFNQSIVKRILRVGKACKEVSLGNYGLQIKDNSKDEIGTLVRDFNHLSGRLDGILSLVQEIHGTNNSKQALNVIKKETKKIINASSLFLLKQKGDSYIIDALTSHSSKTSMQGKQLVATDSCVSWVDDNEDIFIINDTLSHTMKNNNGHFAKYILHSTNSHSLLVMKIFDKHSQGLLLLTKARKDGFEPLHVDILKGLSSMFGHLLLSE